MLYLFASSPFPYSGKTPYRVKAMVTIRQFTTTVTLQTNIVRAHGGARGFREHLISQRDLSVQQLSMMPNT